ncbi:MAG: T9SS type A sorting domain-containing protein [Ginsengibacter sp.]
MKKLYVAIALLTFHVATAQTVTINVTPGTSSNSVLGLSNYHVSESIYTETEIGAGNFITAGTAINHINFNINTLGINTTVTNYKLYLQNVPIGTTTLASGVYSTAGYILVFSGTYTPNALGWVGVDLTTPFTRAAGTNLQLLIERTDNVLHTGYVFQTAAGNTVGATTDPNVLSSRRYNFTSIPVPGTTTLIQTVFRPAIQFVHVFTNDAGLNTLTNPFTSCYSTPQSVSVTLKNEGSATIAPLSAAVTLHVSGANLFSSTINNSTSLAPGATEIIVFSGINLNNPGVSADTVYVTLAGDVSVTNDTLTSSITTATIISSFPVLDDVEGALFFSNTTSTDWTVQNGNYLNLDISGPLAPHSGNKFYLFDSYDADAGVTSKLFSNCLQFPASSTINISFWMSHDNSFAGFLDSLYLDVSVNNGITWTRLAGFGRYDASYALPGWSLQSVNLSTFAGQTVLVAFEGVSQFGEVIGVDDINITVSGPLPVSLVDFNARRYGKVNNLTWNTTQEFNSSHFIIERSTDGRNFAPIGKVNAAGNSSLNKHYTFTDQSPVKGINYYRLQLVDFDNTSKYTPVRRVRNIAVLDLSIYPNPVSSLSKLAINSEMAGIGILTIMDASGQQVLNRHISLITGDNIIPLNFNQLSHGIYILKVMINDELITRKFTR